MQIDATQWLRASGQALAFALADAQIALNDAANALDVLASRPSDLAIETVEELAHIGIAISVGLDRLCGLVNRADRLLAAVLSKDAGGASREGAPNGH